MFRYFRIIRKKLIEQDNVRKYLLYAIGEILLVVIGILIALQVNNWNEQRKDHIKSVEYLNRIVDDLEDDILLLERRIEFWSKVRNEGIIAAGYYKQLYIDNDSLWKQLVTYYNASGFLPYTVNNISFEELKSSASLSLLTDVELRNELSRYYRVGAIKTEFHSSKPPKYREVVRGIIPVHIQEYIRTKCNEPVAALAGGFTSCSSPIPMSEVKTILDNIFSNPEILSSLNFYIVEINLYLSLADSELNDANELVTRIENNLNYH